jgi:hypothetical protein
MASSTPIVSSFGANHITAPLRQRLRAIWHGPPELEPAQQLAQAGDADYSP